MGPHAVLGKWENINPLGVSVLYSMDRSKLSTIPSRLQSGSLHPKHTAVPT